MRAQISLLIMMLFLTMSIHGQQRNIIFILVDDQGWNGTSVEMDPLESGSKSEYYQTANLEQLAFEGITFSRGYAAVAKCSPSRNSFHTGQTTSKSLFTNTDAGTTTGEFLIAPSSSNSIESNLTTFPELIKSLDSNYLTKHFEKWHLGSQGPASDGGAIAIDNEAVLCLKGAVFSSNNGGSKNDDIDNDNGTLNQY